LDVERPAASPERPRTRAAHEWFRRSSCATARTHHSCSQSGELLFSLFINAWHS
jgi:hypothetical protein